MTGKNLYHAFVPVRALCIDILQNRTITLTQRMLWLGLVLQQLQQEEWSGFAPEPWVERMAALSGTEDFAEHSGKIKGNRALYIAQNMKVLTIISANTKV